jgi:hypothetical protein
MEQLKDLKSEIKKSLLFLIIILAIFGLLKYLDLNNDLLINLIA